MVQEVRSILFTDDECRMAVAALLVSRSGGGLNTRHVTRVELDAGAKGARVSICGARGQPAVHALDASELMSALLLFCRNSHIPLSSRSQKRLGLVDGKLALTMSINLKVTPPMVADGTISHAACGPDLSLLHTI